MISSLISLPVRAHPLVRSFALSSTPADKLSCQGSSQKFQAPWLLTLYLFGQASATWTLKWPPNSDHTHSSLVTKSTYTHLRILPADTKVLLQVYSRKTGVVSEQFSGCRNIAPRPTTSLLIHNQQWVRLWVSNGIVPRQRLLLFLPGIILFFLTRKNLWLGLG